jgi:hypothetical protein
MKNRSRWVHVALALSASLSLAMLAVVSSSASHDPEQDEPGAPKGSSAGPARGSSVAMPRGLIGLSITLGLKDEQRTPWNGGVTVSEGRVLSLDLVQGTLDSTVSGSQFKVATKKKAVTKKNLAPTIPAVIHVNLEAPETTTVTVRTGHGMITFRPEALSRTGRNLFLDDRVAIERQEAAVRLTGAGTEDDFPVAVRATDGTIWLAYVEYKPEVPHLTKAASKQEFDTLVPTKNGDRVRLRSFDGTTWSPGIDVTGAGLDVWRPTVAVDGQGKVWIAWAQQIEGDWEIFTRIYTPPAAGASTGSWTEPRRLTNEKGSDFHVVAATDSKGNVWLAWQAFRRGSYQVLALASTTIQTSAVPVPEALIVSVSQADNWSPAIAADGQGGVFVAWDTYDKGNYDVMIRDVGRHGPPMAVASSSRFEARPSLAVDKGNRVWIAYEEGDEQWGKDFAHAGSVANVGLEKNLGFALYIHRTIKLKCLEGGKMMIPAAGSEPKFGAISDRNKSVPRLGFAGDGTLWMLVRHHPVAAGGQGEVWVGSALAFNGENWSPPTRLASSANLIDNRPALAAVGDDLLAVYSSDLRQNANTRVEDDLYAARLASRTASATTPKLVDDQPAPAPTLATVHAEEASDIKKIRDYRISVGGKALRPLRGEFHRHTEVSSHNDGDGMLEDAWRYALDAANHDWMGDGDHDNGFGFEYIWWLIQKSADLHHNPPRFVGAQTYERSVVYPNGHRNVMMPRRGIRPLPRGELPGTEQAGSPDTKLLYAYLKHFGGICASHTSATDMGTDWRDNDPEVEPVVEIYQGHRHNYEVSGAPRSPTQATNIGGYEPKGFVWNALEKGYKLGFESSSDHVSTHLSYAILYAEDTTRPALIDAFKRRHCYAATDNILLDVRSGDHFMGDTFTTKEKPGLQVVVKGTAPVARLHVIRDNKYALTTEPNARDVTFRFVDDNAQPGESHYYYVRVEQADGNLAWGSPMWVSYEK